jgi:hypothetical protein
MLVPAMLVPVVPQLGFVEQKEKQQSPQQTRKQNARRGARFKGFGQQVHEGRGQQGTGRQAQQTLASGVTLIGGLLGPPHQDRGQPNAAHPGGQSGQGNF